MPATSGTKVVGCENKGKDIHGVFFLGFSDNATNRIVDGFGWSHEQTTLEGTVGDKIDTFGFEHA